MAQASTPSLLVETNTNTSMSRHSRVHCRHNGMLGSQLVVKARVGAILDTTKSQFLYLIHERQKQQLCKNLDSNVSWKHKRTYVSWLIAFFASPLVFLSSHSNLQQTNTTANIISEYVKRRVLNVCSGYTCCYLKENELTLEDY